MLKRYEKSPPQTIITISVLEMKIWIY